MAQLALGIAGAFVGSAFGPLGASIGWSLGAALGGALFPEKVQGPRLQDLRVQTSSYGQMTPRLWGTMRIAGNWIDGKDKLDEHEEESGGKGGPEITNFTYSYTGAIRLCERVGIRDSAILGIRRVWGNGRLLNIDSLPMTIYLGDEEQLPDPTLETIHGVGNVPAYRSIAYVVFTDLTLTEFGNALPNLEFECFTHAGDIPVRVSTFDPTVAAYGNVVSGVTSDGTTITVASYHPDVGNYYSVRHFLYDGTPVGDDIDVPGGATGVQAVIANADVAVVNSGPDYFWLVNGTGAGAFLGNFPPGLSVGYMQADRTDPTLGYVYLQFGTVTGGIQRFQCVLVDGIVAAVSSTPDIIAFASGNPGDLSLNGSSTGEFIYLFDAGLYHVYELDPELNLIRDFDCAVALPQEGSSMSYRGGGFFRYGDLWVTNFQSSTEFRMNLLNIGLTTTNFDQPRDVNGVPDFVTAHWVQMVHLGGGYVLGRDGIVLLKPPIQGVPLSEIVADISQDCGLDRDADIDVSDLPDIVDGYLVAQQATGREWIQPLRDVWTFDAFEADKATFVHRGKPAMVTIPDDELAGHVHGEDPPPILGTVRIDELSLPATVNVTFVDASADYQTNTQYGRRQATFATSEVTLNVPVSLSTSKGKSVAQIQCDEAWNERNRFTFYTSSKYLKYTPTDVINAHGLDIRIVDKKETHPGVIQWDGVASRAQAFVQSGVSVPRLDFTSSPPVVVALDATTLYLLDLPLVNDSDDPNGLYAAMAPASGAGWTGAALFKSSDGGVSYSSISSTTSRAVIGTTVDALGNFYGGNIFDEASVVTVVTTGGELASVSEVAVLNGANEAVIGDEVIQFKNAALVDTDTYELTGLLRGRLGTEWAMGTHASDERFALLPTLRVPAPFEELYQVRSYKPVTFGGTVAGAHDQSFTNTGMAWKPYAPVLLGGGTDDVGNVEMHWTRRARVGGGAWLGVDVPLSEVAEFYSVLIFNSDYSLCAREIIASDVQTATYSAADQTTDFGDVQETIYFAVAQIGSINAGTGARGTAPGSGGSDDDPISPITPPWT